MISLDLHIAEIVEKQINANAKSIRIEVSENKGNDTISLKISEICENYKLSQNDFQKGDLADCFSKMFCLHQETDFSVCYISSDVYFELNSEDVKDVFEGMKLDDEEVIACLKDLIEENIA